MGFLTVLSSLAAPHYPLLRWAEESIPIELEHAGRHANLVLGFALLLVARGLSRRRRQAWSLAMIAVGSAIVLHLVKGIDWPEAVLGLALLALLVLWRGEFTAASDPPSVRDGYLGLAAVVLLLPFYTLLGLHLFRIHPAEGIAPFVVLRETGWRLLFADATGVAAGSHHQAWFLNSVSVLGWAGILYAVLMTARGLAPPPRTVSDLEAARRLVALHGRTGTDYMTLWPGNSVFFSPDGGSFIAYRQSADAALALGDPIGSPVSRRVAVVEFGDSTRREGVSHAFFAATEAMLPIYQELGYQSIKIGEEAVVPLAGLEFKGKEWQSTRTSLHRAAREGMTFQVFEGGSVPSGMRTQMEDIAHAWQQEKKLPPMGFTLGRTEDLDDPNVYVAAAVDAQGRVHAFVDWLPVPATRGWVIDLMRRRDESMNGVMEFLIASSLLFFKARGDREASLGTAPLADLAPGERDSLFEKVMGIVYEHGGALYQFRTLFEYKAKFQPEWRGAYLVYERSGDLPRVLLALMRAYFPDLSPKVLGEMIGAAIF
jgi:phosphatidylglycerol lysyltransferase